MMIVQSKTAMALLAVLAATTPSTFAVDFCTPGGGSITVISSTSPDAEGLEQSFELFRSLLGGESNGSGPPAVGGHRQINWDAPFAPFVMPPNFFAEPPVPRGLLLSSASNEFRISNDSDEADADNRFDSINADAAAKFLPFSAPRVFTPVGENKFNIRFAVPGTTTSPATVQGYGGVFVDVDEVDTTKMTFLAQSGCVIAEEYVKPAPGGLSFLGFFSGNGTADVYEIQVVLGSKALDDDTPSDTCDFFCAIFRFLFGWLGGGGDTDDAPDDFVVMDDFLYSEPQAV